MNVCDAYQVEEGNQFYETYDGNLYNKGLTKLYEIRKYNNGETINFPETLQELSYDAISQLNSNTYFEGKIVSNNNLIYENGNLYTPNYEKLLVNNINDGEVLILKDQTQEVSDGQIEYDSKNIDTFIEKQIVNRYCYNISGDSEITESNYLIINDDYPELSAVACKGKELDNYNDFKSINECTYDAICLNRISDISGNEFFDAYDGALFKNGRKELIALDNYNSVVRIPKETEKISDAALYNMVTHKIECSEDNPYFEEYKGMLYTKGREELICIGKTDNNDFVIAKETKSLNKDGLYNFIDHYYYDENGIQPNYIIEDGNEIFSTCNSCLYTNDEKELVLLDKIGISYDGYLHISPKCMNIWQTAKQCIEIGASFGIKTEDNPYIKSVEGEFHRIFYYPEYAHLNLEF